MNRVFRMVAHRCLPLACIALGLLACMNLTLGVNDEKSGPKSIQLQLDNPLYLPDQAFAILADTTLPVTQTLNNTQLTLTVNLPRPLGPDTLWISTSRYSLVMGTYPCLQQADGSLRILEAGIDRDSIAREVLKHLDGTTYPLSIAGAHQAYATLILLGQQPFQSFPITAPLGLDTAAMRTEILRQVAKLGKSLREITTYWTLNYASGYDYESARAGLLALVPKISRSDSATLFPPPPVRLSAPLALAAGLRAEGDPVALTGAFVGDTLLTSVAAEISQGSEIFTQSLFALWLPGPSATKNWNLGDNAASLRALGAPAGHYTLKLTVTDILARSDTQSLEFDVLPPPDHNGPQIQFLSPSSDTSVETSVSSFDVIIAASDPSGIDSVTIGGQPATRDSRGNFHRTVDLPTQGYPTSITIQAFDSAHNLTDTALSITRQLAPGSNAPIFQLLSPTTVSSVLAFDSSTLRLAWTFEDWRDVDPASVTVTGAATIEQLESTWVANVVLPPNDREQRLAINAINSQGNGGFIELRATRHKDPIAPQIQALLGSRSVAFETNSVLVSWRIIDNHKLKSVAVQIGSQTTNFAPNADSTYAITLTPTSTENIAVVTALDSTGNSSQNVVRITRLADKTGPTVKFLSPEPNLVLSASITSVLVSVLASDASGIDSVQINGLKADTSKGTYLRQITTLASGTPTTLRIKAFDKAGNATETSYSILRLAPPTNHHPVLTLLAPLGTNVLPFDSTSVVVRWKLVDTLYPIDPTSVKINGVQALREGESNWSLRVPLPPTGTPFAIQCLAANNRGNTTAASVQVTRQRDTKPPTVTRLTTNPKVLAFDTTALTVGWIITDNHKVGKVLINNLVANQSGSTYSLRVKVPNPTNKIILQAFDSTGNLTKDSLEYARQKDTVRPLIKRITYPNTNTTIAYPSIQAVTVSYTITDNDSFPTTTVSATVNGHAMTKSGNTFSYRLPLEAGLNPVVVLARDRTGNERKDSIALTTTLKDRDGTALAFKRMPDHKLWTLQNLGTKPLATSQNPKADTAICIAGNCSKYGRAYTWSMAMALAAKCDSVSCAVSSQGLCPTGWHVATIPEWKALIDSAAGGAGKTAIGLTRLRSTASVGKWSTTNVRTCSPSDTIDLSGSDTYGFKLLPTGDEGHPITCGGSTTTLAQYWTPPEAVGSGSVVRFVPDVVFTTMFKTARYALRCVAN